MLGSPAGPGGPSQRGLWPLAPAPVPATASFTAEGLSKYGVYSLFPGGPSFGSALYSHASTIGRFASSQFQQTSGGGTFHTAHKVSDSLFSASGYTFGAPTPPPGSPYSPIPVTHQLELLAKGFNSNSIIIQQPEYPASPVKKQQQVQDKQRCDEKCCSGLRLAQRPCDCQQSGPGSPAKAPRFLDQLNGCSRTNPIEWGGVNVKKEPGACQVAEVTTSVASPFVKLEVTSPTQKTVEHGLINGSIISTSGAGGNIPVGIAIARQRVHQEIISSPSLPPTGLLTTVAGGTHLKELDPVAIPASMAATSTMGGAQGGALLQCTDERGAGFAAWQMGGSQGHALTAPTLWQYPAPVPVEPMVPMPPCGFQLVRDPTTGGLLLLPTTAGIEPLQQAVVWPGYHQPSSLLLPALPPPPPPLQLLGSASSDYQNAQTHSTRLVAVSTDHAAKRKAAAATLIKIETDVAEPLMATHLFYQHPGSAVILSQTPSADAASGCRSQATSPVHCLTPPPETHADDDGINTSAVQDASNQTDIPASSDDDEACEVEKFVDVRSKTLPEKVPEEIKVPNPSPNREDLKNEQVDVRISPKVLPEAKLRVEAVPNCGNAVVGVKEQVKRGKPDLSGLELLSNSIVEFEKKISETDDKKITETDGTVLKSYVEEKKVLNLEVGEAKDNWKIPERAEDSLAGLDLLCALAEQRILEESGKPDKELLDDRNSSRSSKSIGKESKEKSREKRRREKRKKKHRDSSEPKRKKIKSYDDRERHRKRKEEKAMRIFEKNEIGAKAEKKCTCLPEQDLARGKSVDQDKYKAYRTPRSEEEVRKFIASKTQAGCCKGEWPCMNAMELDMRMRLAELQRQYREKQKELSKLKPKKHASRSSRKKSSSSDRSERTTSHTPPPHLDKMDCEPLKQITERETEEKPQMVIMTMPKLDEEVYPEKLSSSKKRKVGRPKKLQQTTENSAVTETIVAKKNKSLVGYLLAANKKFEQGTMSRYSEDLVAVKVKKNRNNNDVVMRVATNIRPKLKAEATVKSYPDEDLNDWEETVKDHFKKVDEKSCEEKPIEKSLKVVENPISVNEKVNKFEKNICTEINTSENSFKYSFIKEANSLKGLKENSPIKSNHQSEDNSSVKKQSSRKEKSILNESKLMKNKQEVSLKDNQLLKEKPCLPEFLPRTESPDHKEFEIVEEVKPEDTRCTLTADLLNVDKLRVLTAMGGLFYAGQLNALEPPDVYSIILDGERGNRPHIMSREEILRDAIVEVAPKSAEDLPVGTRLCAYWSQQYRCLYPGSVAEPGTPDPHLDGRFVSVEFDDGDSGKIALEDIRLLPPDYPIIEYDPNPLLSLSKRRRRASTSISVEEKTSKAVLESLKMPLPSIDHDPEKENEDTNKRAVTKEKKRLKKKKREKLRQKLAHEERKKKKKHRCSDENCKHRKHHKKRRKHKKHHEKTKVTDLNVQIPIQMETEIISNKEIETENFNKQPEDKNLLKEEDFVPNPEDEVTMDDIIEATKLNSDKKSKKIRDRQESCESRSKMSAFLPARQLWGWAGKGYKRQRAKGRSKKSFYKSIQRGKETITVGDSAVFLSTGRPDRPYIGHIEAMWELCGTMVVRVKWFYHPEETVGCPQNLQYPGALFESPHVDENDVQTISHKCDVLPLKDYTERLGDDPRRYAMIYDNNDIYYLAGRYDPTTQIMKIEPGIPFAEV